MTLIRCPDLEIQRGQRVALMGPNGSGKTTLLRMIVGELPPLQGHVRLGHKVVINYYAQAHEGLRMDATVLEEIRRIDPLIKETPARTLLGRFLFSGDDVYKRIGDLSGGERSRVALAQLTLMGGNLLVLDEPTNHLDIGAREALEGVLNEYRGSILFVSHDRYFVDAVADTIWMVQDGGIEAFDGTYSEYAAFQEAGDDRRPTNDQRRPTNDGRRQATNDERRKTKDEGRRTTDQRPTTNDQRPTTDHRRPTTSDRRRRTKDEGRRTTDDGRRTTDEGRGANSQRGDQPPTPNPKSKIQNPKSAERKRQRKLASLEEEIEMLEAELKQIEADMNAAGAKGDRGRVTTLGIQYAEVNDMISSRMEEWAKLAQ